MLGLKITHVSQRGYWSPLSGLVYIKELLSQPRLTTLRLICAVCLCVHILCDIRRGNSNRWFRWTYIHIRHLHHLKFRLLLLLELCKQLETVICFLFSLKYLLGPLRGSGIRLVWVSLIRDQDIGCKCLHLDDMLDYLPRQGNTIYIAYNHLNYPTLTANFCVVCKITAIRQTSSGS